MKKVKKCKFGCFPCKVTQAGDKQQLAIFLPNKCDVPAIFF